jgi:hypothetical protein
MAIYLNNKDVALEANETGSDFEKKYHRELKEIDKLFDRFRGKDGNSIIQISRPDGERQKSLTSKRIKKLPNIALPSEVPYYDSKVGAMSIRYSKMPPRREAENKLSWDTRHIMLEETMVIGERDKDLAWFLLYASDLVGKGIYQLVDNEMKYQGTFDSIIVQRDVMIALDPKDEDLVRFVAQKFVTENVMNTPVKTLIVQVNDWCGANKKWAEVWKAIEGYNSKKVLDKQGISELEWDGEPVTMLACPVEIKQPALIEQAKALGIPLTTPIQTKNVLYSLIKHVEKVKELQPTE